MQVGAHLISARMDFPLRPAVKFMIITIVFGRSGAEALAKVLLDTGGAGLRRLNLRRNFIGTGGAQAVLKLLGPPKQRSADLLPLNFGKENSFLVFPLQ